MDYKITHDTVLKVNLSALQNNLNYYKSLLQSTTKIMVMVKAFSYGLGVKEVALLLQKNKVDYLGVAFVEGGVELANLGITTPIIVMNSDRNAFEEIIKYKLQPSIFSIEQLQRFIAAVQKHTTKFIAPYPIHLKLDSGMNRLGFKKEDFFDLTQLLKQHSEIKVSSIFSHLSASDQQMYDGFSEQQITHFEKLSNAIEKKIGYQCIKHILNSAACSRFIKHQQNMVRLGLGLYGIDVLSDDSPIQTTATLVSRITQVKIIQKGESVGYNRAFIASKTMQIAIVALGYADGINRRLGNSNGYMLVKGKKAKYVGDICMDMCIINVSNIDVKDGEEVTIFGEKPSVKELAEQLNTIPYEILTSVSSRVKREYIYDDE